MAKTQEQAALEHRTAAYFKGLAAEETKLENALSAAAQEMDFDEP